MSHIPERKEKDCLNCGATLQGRYCHVCGQENVEPKETFWHMFTHFFYDITHFDSKFFETVKDLVFRPGFLSKEYVKGKRASYLHPVRMYVFTSAIFFLIFFSVFKPESSVKTNTEKIVSVPDRMEIARILKEQLKKDPNNVKIKKQLLFIQDTTYPVKVKDLLDMEIGGSFISFTRSHYRSFDEYDSTQKILPASERDGWFRHRLIRKEIELNNRFRENPNEASKKFTESLLHRLPYMLFISLPLFALLLKLVYIRRKQFYYVDHGMFTIHLYVFTFLLLLAVFGLNELQKTKGFGWLGFLIAVLFIGLFFYLYKAMRNFYGQRRAKTVFKFLFVAFFSLIMMLILFVLFLFFSAVMF